MFDPLTIGAAVLPSIIDVLKGAANKWLAPANYKPVNVTEYLQMEASDLARFKAINDAGQGAASYPWVEAVVKLQRPLVAAVTLGTWAASHLVLDVEVQAVDNIAAAVFFYLFGDRTLGYMAKDKKQ